MSASFSEFSRKGKNPIILTLIFAAFEIAVFVVSIAALHIPAVPVGCLVILETALAALLRKVPVYIHGLAILVQLIAGFVTGKAVFAILICLVYAFALILFTLWQEKE
ncbi:MAG: hypothetical protein PUG16_01165 [Lachnospiraceae bacterium]|nr:hypothetical protein [Lachnospiraceae bacterium]